MAHGHLYEIPVVFFLYTWCRYHVLLWGTPIILVVSPNWDPHFEPQNMQIRIIGRKPHMEHLHALPRFWLISCVVVLGVLLTASMVAVLEVTQARSQG